MTIAVEPALIPLRSRSGWVRDVAIIDPVDLALVQDWSWSLSTTGYAHRNQRVDGRSRIVYMHRFLMGLEHGDSREVDHINHHRLDNRRANLRVVTKEQNRQNVLAHPGASSRFKCVSLHKATGLWRVTVKKSGRQLSLGYYRSEIEAALAYETWRAEHRPLVAPDRQLTIKRKR